MKKLYQTPSLYTVSVPLEDVLTMSVEENGSGDRILWSEGE